MKKMQNLKIKNKFLNVNYKVKEEKNKMIYFETKRLIIRNWKTSDLKPFYHMNCDKDVMEYFPKCLSLLETKTFYEQIQKHFLKNSYGIYAVELKETRKFIGFVGFQNVDFNYDFAPSVEIGWRLSKNNWGKGLATEAAKACLNYAKEHLNFNEVYSFTSIFNFKSEKVMKKIGMKKVREFFHPKIDKTSNLSKHNLYKIKIN